MGWILLDYGKIAFEFAIRSHFSKGNGFMLNCDQIFEKLKLWAARQPKSFVDVRPTPTPEDTMAEDVIDGYYVLQEFDFPQQYSTNNILPFM